MKGQRLRIELRLDGELYLRVFQTDTEKPDGDPEVAWTSPWFVPYQ